MRAQVRLFSVTIRQIGRGASLRSYNIGGISSPSSRRRYSYAESHEDTGSPWKWPPLAVWKIQATNSLVAQEIAFRLSYLA
jgi:hypothetical protein